jgi:hypothetical protein
MFEDSIDNKWVGLPTLNNDPSKWSISGDFRHSAQHE